MDKPRQRAFRLLVGRARSIGALELGNAASCRRTYTLAAGVAVRRLPMRFPKPPLARPQLTWPRAANSQTRCLGFRGCRGHARRAQLVDQFPESLARARASAYTASTASTFQARRCVAPWEFQISIANFLLGLLSALRLALEDRFHHPRHSRLLRLLAKAGDRLGGWLMRNDHTAAVRVYR